MNLQDLYTIAAVVCAAATVGGIILGLFIGYREPIRKTETKLKRIHAANTDDNEEGH